MSTDSACTNPQRESQVISELIAMEKVQASLSDQINQLEDRLALAMREPNSTTGEDSAEEISLVPLAHRLRKNRYDAERHFSKIEDLLDRLEL